MNNSTSGFTSGSPIIIVKVIPPNLDDAMEEQFSVLENGQSYFIVNNEFVAHQVLSSREIDELIAIVKSNPSRGGGSVNSKESNVMLRERDPSLKNIDTVVLYSDVTSTPVHALQFLRKKFETATKW